MVRVRRGLSLRSDSVGYTKDDLGELVVTIETASAFSRGLGQFEDHRECCLVVKTSLGTHRAVADRRERAFDEIGRAQMLPVLGREVVEGEQRSFQPSSMRTRRPCSESSARSRALMP